MPRTRLHGLGSTRLGQGSWRSLSRSSGWSRRSANCSGRSRLRPVQTHRSTRLSVQSRIRGNHHGEIQPAAAGRGLRRSSTDGNCELGQTWPPARFPSDHAEVQSAALPRSARYRPRRPGGRGRRPGSLHSGFAKLDAFRGDSDILTWLTRITLNEANGRLRRRRQTVTMDQFEAAEGQATNVISFPLPEGCDSPEAGAARAEVRRQIEDAVDGLPPIYRIVFILRDVDGCTVNETAAALDLKPETVRTRHHRARALLRTVLDRKLAGPLSGAFPFLGGRCQRITNAMLERLAPPYGWRG